MREHVVRIDGDAALCDCGGFAAYRSDGDAAVRDALRHLDAHGHEARLVWGPDDEAVGGLA